MKVSMYTLSTCPWCMKTKAFFNAKKIQFDYIDYDLADEETQARIMDELTEAGANGFPFVKINDEIIMGYNPERFEQLLSVERNLV
jgi:glutaredoxin